MVLESLIYPLKAEKKPWEMLFVGLLYSSIATFLSLWVFRTQAALVHVFLIVAASIPLIYNTIKLEESKDLEIYEEKALLKEHSKAISFLMLLFLGVTLSCIIWYVALPSNLVDSLFSVQEKTISDINNYISGNSVQTFTMFSTIFFNNVKVLSFCILFSFLYGAGAIFILTWNATVIGTAIGNYIRTNLAALAGVIGLSKAGGYLKVVSLGLLKYSIHGVPEILGYFVGGLAGGIISVAIIRHHFSTKKFSNIMIDASDLLMISIGIMFVAAILEVYVTPLVFPF